jgi:gas vesicle protein
MSLIKRTLKFTAGGITGAAVGALAGLMVAPESGHDFQQSLRDRLRRSKVAGAEARAATQNELIRKFRAKVNDESALKEVEVRTNEQRELALGTQDTAPAVPPVVAS